ncbi:hypothetical protein [Streptomyces sp. MNU89]|uniref:hypothetical protein n=1 Tax=Streptomyces sp. MNU89 TaxID=2560025 RepID=UPI001E5FEF8F|nr:hypothetical protein [Streptomyces sp. MNU89]MCC9738400.1 hypothetical protein [Streptomyces sp. MNU89]
MTEPRVPVHVSNHLFCVVDSDTYDITSADYSDGLILVMARGAMIRTGIHTGTVHVTARPLNDPPDQPDPGPWEEITEASIYTHTGQLGVDILYPDTYPDTYLDLPDLAHAGPGWYRLRAHARGRDTAPGALRDDSDEDYLLLCWPAPRSATNPIHTRPAPGKA